MPNIMHGRVNKTEVILQAILKPKVGIGMTENTLKEHFNNNKKYFSKIEHRNSTVHS